MKSFALFSIVSLSLLSSSVSQELNDISLAQKHPRSSLEQIITPREAWQPFPTWADRDGLGQIPENIREIAIAEATKLLQTDWPPLPASVFLQYARDGNRSNYEALSFGRRHKLAALVLAELFEGQGRFMDQIVDGVWAVCEESFWGVPAHNDGRGLPDVDRPIVDLFAAETGAMMAWIYYLLAPQLDEINPLVTQRMLRETDARILTPYLEHNDWGWLGFSWRQRSGYQRPVNNWNPWINSNIITCALILEQDPQRRLDIL
ncbi:heparinase, partial [candidate division KSB1 bacterium]